MFSRVPSSLSTPVALRAWMPLGLAALLLLQAVPAAAEGDEPGSYIAPEGTAARRHLEERGVKVVDEAEGTLEQLWRGLDEKGKVLRDYPMAFAKAAVHVLPFYLAAEAGMVNPQLGGLLTTAAAVEFWASLSEKRLGRLIGYLGAPLVGLAAYGLIGMGLGSDVPFVRDLVAQHGVQIAMGAALAAKPAQWTWSKAKKHLIEPLITKFDAMQRRRATRKAASDHLERQRRAQETLSSDPLRGLRKQVREPGIRTTVEPGALHRALDRLPLIGGLRRRMRGERERDER